MEYHLSEILLDEELLNLYLFSFGETQSATEEEVSDIQGRWSLTLDVDDQYLKFVREMVWERLQERFSQSQSQSQKGV